MIGLDSDKHESDLINKSMNQMTAMFDELMNRLMQ